MEPSAASSDPSISSTDSVWAKWAFFRNAPARTFIAFFRPWHSRIRSFIIGSTTAEMVRSVKRPVMLFR